MNQRAYCGPLLRRAATMRKLLLLFAVLFCLLAGLATAQDLTPAAKPAVSMAPPVVTTVSRGKASTVELQFRVIPGYHINSHEPKSSFLIPTAVQLDPPSDLMISNVTYPPGQDMSFPFSPDEKLNVYTGDFSIDLLVRCLHTASPGTYKIHGTFKYQACDDRACYPPKQLPVAFEVKVAKPTRPHRPNPGQSPM